MAVTKQTFNVNFSQGLDTKTDPFQVSPGRFLKLQNTVFSKGGLLQKRNGYADLTALPNPSKFVTTFNGNLTSIGSMLQAYSQPSKTWVDRGSIKPVDLDVLPLIRSNTNQSYADSAISDSGLICTVFTDNITNSPGTTAPVYKYVIADVRTGQNLVAPAIITPATGVVTGSPRVFVLGRNFIIVFTNNISGTYHLQYIAINITTLSVGSNVDISNAYTPASTVNFDAVVANNSLYLAWNSNSTSIKMTYIDSTLVQHNTVTFAGKVATIMSVTADASQSTAVIYASFYDSGSQNGYSLAVNQQLNTVLAPTQTITTENVANITATAQNRILTIFYEVNNAYSYDMAIPTNYIKTNTLTQAGVLGSATVVRRSIGLASKAFLVAGVSYFTSLYYSQFQPTYFIIDHAGNIILKLAYSNGSSGYYITGLPKVSVSGQVVQFPYLIRDLTEAVNKTQGVPNVGGIHTQQGINLATVNFNPSSLVTSEIGNNLHIAGGFLWSYDGYTPVEQNFFLWPDNVEATFQHGGSITTQDYYYQVTYEWSDNQGNIFKSAPSIPLHIPSSSLSGIDNSIILNIPTLRLTYKVSNPVKIVVYRWSTAQQTFYQVTSVIAPVLNTTGGDSVQFIDTFADASIIGNNILYTTGGVVEDIGPPATSIMALFKSRLFLVDAEDKNLIWYSKQVIEATPVEMSDLFTIFLPPTTATQVNNGPITALSVLDDKLIIFRKDAIYYITGNGPDNTGANNDFSEPVFITSTVGCANPQSIVFMPNGLMFQSDKGIWLLGRDLQTSYIGAAVEEFNSAVVNSSVNVPGTNEVRFTLGDNSTLMYDYYFNQWGEFTNVPAISSTIYQGLHTYITDDGEVRQETPGKYLDGSNPVLMAFTTSWFNLAGLQGFERSYFFYLLATYLSPHKLKVDIAYDYNSSPSQSKIITPDNYTPDYGNVGVYGTGVYGGPGNIEQWRFFTDQQKCQSFQISISELYDPSLGQIAGAGLTMSGLDLVVGLKKGYRPIAAARSTG